MNQEAEKAAFELLKSKPAQIVIVGGVAIYLLPRAVQYLVAHVEQGTAYLLGAAWKGITGKVGDAEDLVEASGKYYRKEFDKLLDHKEIETLVEVLQETTTTAPTDQPSIDAYRKEMKIPPSAVFLKNPVDGPAIVTFINTGDWAYYGERIINNQSYWLLLPVTVSLFYFEEEEQFQHASEKGHCPSGWKRINIEQIEMCTRTINKQIVIAPILSGKVDMLVLAQTFL